MVANQGQGGLVGVVQALPANRPMQGGNPADGFLAPVRPALLPGQVLLSRSQPGCGGFEVARVGGVDAFGGSQERGDPQVNTGDRTRGRQGFGLDLDGDDDEPAGAPSGTLTLYRHLPQDGALREG